MHGGTARVAHHCVKKPDMVLNGNLRKMEIVA
jgi:hypothetical protein